MQNSKNNYGVKTITLIDRDIIRQLIIPQEKTDDKAVVLPSVVYNEIMENSQVRNIRRV